MPAAPAYNKVSEVASQSPKGKGTEVSADVNNQLDANRMDRSYNPINSAKKSSISSELNSDSSKYKNGPTLS